MESHVNKRAAASCTSVFAPTATRAFTRTRKRTRALLITHFRIFCIPCGFRYAIEMYGESRYVHFQVDTIVMPHIFGFGTARISEWRLNHIHSTYDAEVINASVSDSSAEIDYRYMKLCVESCYLIGP